MKKGKKQTGYKEVDGESGGVGGTGGLVDTQGAESLPWANMMLPIGQKLFVCMSVSVFTKLTNTMWLCHLHCC